MPTYTFKKDDEEKTLVLSFSEYDQWKLDNPEWQQVLTTNGGFISSRRGIHANASDNFKDRLREMKKIAGRHERINL